MTRCIFISFKHSDEKKKCHTNNLSSQYFMQHSFLAKCALIIFSKNYVWKKTYHFDEISSLSPNKSEKMQTLEESIQFFSVLSSLSPDSQSSV